MDLVHQLITVNQEQQQDMICLCIFTHGGKYNELEFSDGVTIKLSTLTRPIKRAPRFRRLPKLFFIQACRGGDYVPFERPCIHGFEINLRAVAAQTAIHRQTRSLTTRAGNRLRFPPPSLRRRRLHPNADSAEFWSCPPEYKSYRRGGNPAPLSDFVKHLSDTLDNYGRMRSLQAISLTVNGKMMDEEPIVIVQPDGVAEQIYQQSWFEHGLDKPCNFFQPQPRHRPGTRRSATADYNCLISRQQSSNLLTTTTARTPTTNSTTTTTATRRERAAEDGVDETVREKYGSHPHVMDYALQSYPTSPIPPAQPSHIYYIDQMAVTSIKFRYPQTRWEAAQEYLTSLRIKAKWFILLITIAFAVGCLTAGLGLGLCGNKSDNNTTVTTTAASTTTMHTTTATTTTATISTTTTKNTTCANEAQPVRYPE